MALATSCDDNDANWFLLLAMMPARLGPDGWRLSPQRHLRVSSQAFCWNK
jgi:hypothetical protein